MTKLSNLIGVVLWLSAVALVGCGTVTAADPHDGAAGAAQPGGGAGGAGGQFAAGGRDSGGPAGQGGGAGQVTTGPCAGLCSNPVIAVLMPHVPLMLTDQAGPCFSVANSTAGYVPSINCSQTGIIAVNGQLLDYCPPGVTNALRVSEIDGGYCVSFAVAAPSSSYVTLQ